MALSRAGFKTLQAVAGLLKSGIERQRLPEVRDGVRSVVHPLVDEAPRRKGAC